MAYLPISVGQTLTLDTTSCSAGADPVFHLFAQSLNQIGFDNDGGGFPNARLVVSGSGNQTLLLVMRARTNTSVGTCTVRRNGATLDAAMPVGGVQLAASELTFSANNRLHAVLTPGGSRMPLLMRFSPSLTDATGFSLGNGIGGASWTTLQGNESHFLVGTPRIRNGATVTTFRLGNVRLLSNDNLTDPDLDGLGSLLEAALGTCPNQDPTPCNPKTSHGEDSDNDGLRDGEEVLGTAGFLTGGVDDIPFSRWGADPLRKDVFVEVDYLTDLPAPVSGQNPFAWLRANPNAGVGYWSTGTLDTWVEHARDPFTPDTPNNHVGNLSPPGGTAFNGIALHLDLGVAPDIATDEEWFGQYTTGTTHAVVPDLIVRITKTMTGTAWVQIQGAWASVSVTGLTRLQIATALGQAAISTGQPVQVKSVTSDATTATVTIEATVDGQHFTRGVQLPDVTGGQILRESDPSLRSQYETDAGQVDSVRRGRFRYAVITGLQDGGQADGARFVSGIWHGGFVHELGHTLGMDHWGHSDWGHYDVECIPNYLSLMRYGATDAFSYRFSDSTVGLGLNPAAAAESTPLGGGFDHGIYAGAPWSYVANYLQVDWNRNGIMHGAGILTRAPALHSLDASCKAFVVGKQSLSTATDVQGPVDLTRAGTRLYAFWVTPSTMSYRFTTLGAVGNKSCTGQADPFGGTCLTWSATNTLASGGAYRNVSAYAFGGSIFVAFSLADNSLYLRRYSVNANGTLTLAQTSNWSSTTQERSTRSPELVEFYSGGAGVLSVIYLAESGEFRQRQWNGTTWAAHVALIDNATGLPIPGGEAPAAKAWPDSNITVGWTDAQRRTVAILPGAAGVMNVYDLLHANGNWSRRLTMLDNGGNSITTEGKPFIEYRPLRRSNGSLESSAFPGHFMLGWSDDDGSGAVPPITRARFRLSTLCSQTSPPGAGLTLLPAGDYLDNTWANDQRGTQASPTRTAASLYTDSTIDNVFGLVAMDVPSSQGVYFLPHADGSPSHVFSVFSDFNIMEDYICDTLSLYRSMGCLGVSVMD